MDGGSKMGRIISGSVQRGIGVDIQTLSGQSVPNIEAGVNEVWEALVGGVPGNGDVIALDLGGVSYAYSYVMADTTAMMATGLANAANLGSYDERFYTIGGTLDVGDEITLDINGVPYVYTVIPADTPALVATGLAALAVADPLYTVTAFGPAINVKKTLRGAGALVTCSWTTDPGGDATCVESIMVVGVVGQVDWLASVIGSTVMLEYQTPGPYGGAAPTEIVAHFGAGTVTLAAPAVDTPGSAPWGVTGGVSTGSFRTPEATSLVTVTGGVSVDIGYWGYFGTLGWVLIQAAATKLPGSHADIVPCGSAQRVIAVTSNYVGASDVDVTIQG